MNCFSLAVVFSLLLSFRAYAEDIVIKFATLAPEGSTWMNVLEDWNREIMQKSGGRMKFRIYSGGVSGDEKDVVRKIRLGQLAAGGFTGVGLGEIAPEVRLLDAPFLVRNTRDADLLYRKFEKDWKNAFLKKGYVFLGWAEVGLVYFFTNRPIQNLTDLKGVKMWLWEGDPIAKAAFEALGVNAVQLSITDVLTSLQTGLIDGVYSSPLALVALQWFARMKYMYDYPLANASGAVLISKTFFDKMPQDLQNLLTSTGKNHLERLTEASRKENKEAIATLKKNGIQIVSPKNEDEIRTYQKIGGKARRALAGKLYSADLLEKIEKSLEESGTTRK